MLIAALFASHPAQGQVADAPDGMVAQIPVNYTEAKVGNFTLPDVLKMFDGKAVTDARMWTEQRRPELLKYYQTEIYGKIPVTAPKVFWQVVSTDSNALGGAAVMKKLAGHMGAPDGPAFNVTLYTPAKAAKPVPVLIDLSLFPPGGPARGRAPGASTATGTAPVTGTAPAVTVAAGASVRGPAGPPRGAPIELVIAHGFGLAIIYHAEIETDASGMPNVNIVRKIALAPGQTAPASDEWGTIAAWAWGISRFVDYLETDKDVDARRIAITGASRGGKTVLWEAASEPRIALCIASCSGEGGASLARRYYGETIAHLVAPTRYPYQFAGNYAKYAKDPNTLAVDTHMLIALVAPRPLLLQTGNTDRWSDPKGEFEAATAATPVYQLLGKQGLDSPFPQASQLVGHDLSYYMHDGGHGVIPSDWDIYLKFMEAHFAQTP